MFTTLFLVLVGISISFLLSAWISYQEHPTVRSFKGGKNTNCSSAALTICPTYGIMATFKIAAYCVRDQSYNTRKIMPCFLQTRGSFRSKPGDKFYIHSPYDLPDFEKPTVVPLFAANHIFEIKIIEERADPAIRKVSIQQRKCRFPDENFLTVISHYTNAWCRMQCRMDMVLKLCNCFPHFYRTSKGITNSFKEWLDKTSFNVISYIGDMKILVIERVFWFVLFSAAIYGCCNSAWQMFKDNDPIIDELHVSQVEIPYKFPTFTICGQIPYPGLKHLKEEFQAMFRKKREVTSLEIRMNLTLGPYTLLERFTAKYFSIHSGIDILTGTIELSGTETALYESIWRVFRPQEIEPDPDISEWPPEIRGCRHPDEVLANQFYPKYSYTACIASCRAREMMQKCGDQKGIVSIKVIPGHEKIRLRLKTGKLDVFGKYLLRIK
ncbi:hypothetical protein C0J52_07706 [Blattella germanica]|nr:hypothetical protein C0J52_07706 [Blattella germanica]